MEQQRVRALWLGLALAGCAVGWLGQAAAQASRPAAGCQVAAFRGLALSTHDPQERAQRALEWVRRQAASCTRQQLLIIGSNRSAWLGTADTPALMQAIDAAIESRSAGDADGIALLYGSSPKPAAPASAQVATSGERPPPVVPPPVIVAPAMQPTTQVVVQPGPLAPPAVPASGRASGPMPASAPASAPSPVPASAASAPASAPAAAAVPASATTPFASVPRPARPGSAPRP